MIYLTHYDLLPVSSNMDNLIVWKLAAIWSKIIEVAKVRTLKCIEVKVPGFLPWL